MPSRILIIQGHPDPDPQRLCRALAEAYAEGAREAGHLVERIDIAGLPLPLLTSQQAFEEQPAPEGLAPAQAALAAAQHVVLIFPLWLGTMPAALKAFLEQVLRPGFAFRYREKAMPEKLLAGRSVRVVVTMGMPSLAYRWWFGAHGLRGLEANILRFVGLKPVRRSLFGNVAGASDKRRRRWLEEMRGLGRQGL